MTFSVLIRMNLNDCFLEYHIDLFRLEHWGKGNFLPLWPNLMESGQKGCQVVDLLHVCVTPFLNTMKITLISLLSKFGVYTKNLKKNSPSAVGIIKINLRCSDAFNVYYLYWLFSDGMRGGLKHFYDLNTCEIRTYFWFVLSHSLLHVMLRKSANVFIWRVT